MTVGFQLKENKKHPDNDGLTKIVRDIVAKTECLKFADESDRGSFDMVYRDSDDLPSYDDHYEVLGILAYAGEQYCVAYCNTSKGREDKTTGDHEKKLFDQAKIERVDGFIAFMDDRTIDTNWDEPERYFGNTKDQARLEFFRSIAREIQTKYSELVDRTVIFYGIKKDAKGELVTSSNP